MIGPAFCGKHSISSRLAGGSRRVLTLDDCIEWAIAACGKKKKLLAAGPENARLVEELIRFLEVQEGDMEAASGKKSKLLSSSLCRFH